jgi:hypothetical protein
MPRRLAAISAALVSSASSLASSCQTSLASSMFHSLNEICFEIRRKKGKNHLSLFQNPVGFEISLRKPGFRIFFHT